MSGRGMKNAGTDNEFVRTEDRPVPSGPLRLGLGDQGLVSRLVALMAILFLTVVFIDAPVRDLAQSLDPSVKIVVRFLSKIGNSTWPIVFGLVGLGILFLLGRSDDRFDRSILANSRSILTLLVVSVMSSGLIASLTKNSIGRMRPSTEAEAHVLEFSVMAFKAGWASFPSGHSTTAVAAGVALAICFPRFAWGWLIIGGVGALTRALAGVHWVSDCIAGSVLGATVAILLHRWMQGRGHRFDLPPGSLRQILLGLARLPLRAARKATAALGKTGSGESR